jgi:hypothetical protein
MPDDVDAGHVVEMRVVKVQVQQVTPNVSLTLVPLQLRHLFSVPSVAYYTV